MFSTESFNKMIEDSDMKMETIYTRANLSKQVFYDIRKPIWNSRLSRERILAVARVVGANVADYFPELEEDVTQIMGKPAESLQAYKIIDEVKEYMEDLTIETKRFRDEHILALQENIRLQGEIISMLREQKEEA